MCTSQELRAAAEPYKSFPKAVAVVVQTMFDKGATQVTINCLSHTVNGVGVHPRISCDVDCFNLSEMELDSSINKPAWALAHIHHAESFRANGKDYTFIGIGHGGGVNPKQDRQGKRIIRELPRYLSPGEAKCVLIIDETGERHPLSMRSASATFGGLRVSWPEKMIGFGREGLSLKFGAVRVSMRSFIDRLILEPAEHKQIILLTHLWLSGTIEVEVADLKVTNIPVPPDSSDDFFNFLYWSGFADQLAKAILQIVPTVALREMNKKVATELEDFCNENGDLTLDKHTYKLICASEYNLWRVESVVLGDGYVPSGESFIRIFINSAYPVFRTIDPNRDEIMQVIWWQLAIWIAQNQPEVFAQLVNFYQRVNAIYLALREQNPKRGNE